MSTYFLGVDGGQSSTTAMIGDETGRVIGYGRGGP
ncbi:MAG: ATPase, partial [Bryobacterales bacterium]|nr:ATPase [Bryobacterales bacterium]